MITATHFSKQALWLSLAINALLFAVCYGLLYPSFGTVDDTEMQLVISGQMLSPEPQAQVRWSHWFLGMMLSNLYQLNKTVPWYGLSFYLAHFLSMTGLLYVTLRLQGSYWRLAMYLAAFCIAELPLLQTVQFTSTAIVAASSGAILLWWALRAPKKAEVIASLIIGVILVVWATLLRKEVFYLMAIVTSPLLIHAIFYQKKYWWSRAIAISAVLLLCIGLLGIQRLMVQQDAGWKDYFERQETGVPPALLDYDWEGYRWNTVTADKYHAEVGWSYNDYILYKSWFMADTAVYGTTSFKKIKELMGAGPHFSKQRVKDRIKWAFYYNDLHDYWFNCFLAMGLGLLVASFSSLRGFGWVISSTIVLTVALALFLIVTRYLPERVSFPLCWFHLQLVLLVAGLGNEIPRRYKVGIMGIWAILCLAAIKPALRLADEVRKKQNQWTLALKQLDPKPDQLFVSAACRYYEPLALPLEPIFRRPFTDFKALDFGHLANTPTYHKQLKSMGFGNILLDMIDHEKVFFVGAHNSIFMDWYRQFLLEHYQKNIKFELYKDHPEVNTAVFRVRSIVIDTLNPENINK